MILMCSTRVQVFSSFPPSVVCWAVGCGRACEFMGYYGRVLALTVSSHCLLPHSPLACLDTGRSPSKALTRCWQYGIEITRNELTPFINFLSQAFIQSQQQKELGMVARPCLQSPALGKTRQCGVMISRLAWTTYWDPVSKNKHKQTRQTEKD